MRSHCGAARRRAGGLALAELMVALLLGAIVTAVAGAVLLTGSAGYRDHAASARLADSGRHALALIGQAVRQAAYTDWDDGAEAGAAPAGAASEAAAAIAGLDAHSVARGSDGIEAPLADAVNGSDVLALRYAGSGAAAADGSVLNCAGFGVGRAPTEQQRGWSIFYVALGADGEAELRCKYRGASGWGADAIVRGVDAFQVLYGLDTDTPPDGVVNRYLNARALDALDAALVLSGEDAAERARDFNRKTHWKRVAAVRVALLLHGEAHTRNEGTPRSFDLFGADYTAAAGGDAGVRIDERQMPASLKMRARRVFVSSIVLRNPPGGV